MRVYKVYKHPQSGFTLLEALIAVLVLSFGLLGVAAMQLKSMQSSHLSYGRSVATVAAQDAVERLWIELGSSPPTCPEPSTVIDAWHNEWVQKLPSLIKANSIVRLAGCDYRVTIGWGDSRFDGEDVSELVYETSLYGESP